MKHEYEYEDEHFDGADKAIITGFLLIFVIIGILIGMVTMYGWLSLNGLLVVK